MQWFRLYHELLDDPKVQRLPADRFKQWINLMCLANQTEPRGSLPSASDVAFRLRMSDDEAAKMLAFFVASGFLDNAGDGSPLLIHGWQNRQKKSDNVTARVNEYRERQAVSEVEADGICGNVASNGIATLQETASPRSRVDVEVESDADLDSEAELTAAAGASGDFEISDVERAVTANIRAVRGMANVDERAVVQHLREVLEARDSPVSPTALKLDSLRFRDYWNEKRNTQPPNKRWSSWPRAMTNWFGSTEENGRPRANGRASPDPYADKRISEESLAKMRADAEANRRARMGAA